MKATNPISLWKKSLLGFLLTCILRTSLVAQCIAPFNSITYDTLIAGTGNNSHVFTIAQFDPNLGTLISAQIHSVISVNYGFTLQNVEAVTRTFTVSVARNDHIQSTALTTPYDNSIDTAIGTFLLDPGVSVSKSPYTVLYRYVNSDSIEGNPVNLLGNGTVNFNYKPLTYTNLTGSNMYYYSATANDTIRFSVTYNYCNNVLLAASMYSFDAIKKDIGKIGLTWTVDNEQPGRSYIVEKSMDGNHFIGTGSAVLSGHDQDARYNDDYFIQDNERRELFFRIRITDAAGAISYSKIKTVDMSLPGKGFFLYPNPSSQFINIILPQFNDWQIEILSPNGSMIQQNRLSNANTGRIDFNHPLASGVYFARVTEQSSLKTHLLSFIVK